MLDGECRNVNIHWMLAAQLYIDYLNGFKKKKKWQKREQESYKGNPFSHKFKFTCIIAINNNSNNNFNGSCRKIMLNICKMAQAQCACARKY